MYDKYSHNKLHCGVTAAGLVDVYLQSGVHDVRRQPVAGGQSPAAVIHPVAVKHHL